jgi:cytochrome oxidase Cu insertion factor (SCO1/SenC/PrrC family)
MDMKIYIKNNINIYIKIYITIFLLSITFLSGTINAQSNKVPPFRMVQSDGKIFMAQYLPIGKPIVILYFSPDCEECQKFTSALISRIDDFRNVSFAMITYQPPETLKAYVKKNNLGVYENIYAGTEYPTLFVRNYYNVIHFPFMALYNKNGDLVKKYTSKEVDLNDLLSNIKMLK